MKEQPYIGVTGLVLPEEVRHLAGSFLDNSVTINATHRPMMGILVCQETLAGQQVSNRRYPPFAKLTRLLAATPDLRFNTIHYKSKQTHDLADQVDGLLSGGIYADRLCQKVQLNIPSPPHTQVREIKQRYPELEMIAQFSPGTYRGKSPAQVVEQFGRYDNSIEHVLLDPSEGQGQPFDIQELLPYYHALRQAFPGLAIGFAGGFTGDNLIARVREIIELIGTNTFSVDAEGGLRDKLSETYGDDLYNQKKVEAYIKAASTAFGLSTPND